MSIVVPWSSCSLLCPQHDIEHLDCGSPSVGDWLSKARQQHQERRVSTYALTDNVGELMAFYSLKTTPVVREVTANSAQQDEVAAHLLWIGLRSDLQKKGYGRHLIVEAMATCVTVAQQMPYRYIILDVDPGAHAGVRKTYQRLGFASQDSESPRMRMKISAAKRVVEAAEGNGYTFCAPLLIRSAAAS